MNWEAAGAIGEIVGAAAVVVTLLHHARETRKNAQVLDATSSREFGHTHCVQLGLELGNRGEQENYVRITRGAIDSWPAWRRFGDEEADSGTFTQGFIEAVNAIDVAPSFEYAHQAKGPAFEREGA